MNPLPTWALLLMGAACGALWWLQRRPSAAVLAVLWWLAAAWSAAIDRGFGCAGDCNFRVDRLLPLPLLLLTVLLAARHLWAARRR